MKCSICQQEGHRSDNRKFHPKPTLILETDVPPPLAQITVAVSSHPILCNEVISAPETTFSHAALKFIEEAKKIHKDASYDYSYVKYVNCDTKVNLYCLKPGHGIFEKVPYIHLKKKSGCPKCLRDQKRRDEAEEKRTDFIQKATNIHKDEYDYSGVDFALDSKKIIIGCKKGHPNFAQLPTAHLQGQGCPLCAHKKIADSKRKSQDEFVSEAKAVHGDLYDYSETVYTGSVERITVKCKREGHTSFPCMATLHLQGQGCPICTREECDARQRLSSAEFIKRSKAIHGDHTYDYNDSEYKGYHYPITIFCKKHGEHFTQTAGSHMSGQGCQKCGIERRIRSQTFTVADFIQRAKQVHGELYDYSEVSYINSQTKVNIKCIKHGVFPQLPNSHLQGYGCNKCAIERNADRCRLEFSEFLERAKEAHGNAYDYSDVEYVSMSKKVKINCNTCGKQFQQFPNNHTRHKFGCPHCAGNAILTTEGFIQKAIIVHGSDRYNYSMSVYSRSNQKVRIQCCISEQVFEQTPNSHLGGSGCPCCKPKYSKPQMLYLAFRSVTNPTIQHALNSGEHRIMGSRYSADGFIPETNHVIEFHGCLWHGCPRCFSATATNPCTKRTFGEEYERTRARQAFIESQGYSYSEIWECDWNRAMRAIVVLQKQWKNIHM